MFPGMTHLPAAIFAPHHQLKHVHAVPAHARHVVLAHGHLYRIERQLQAESHFLEINKPHPGYVVGFHLELVDVDDFSG